VFLLPSYEILFFKISREIRATYLVLTSRTLTVTRQCFMWISYTEFYSNRSRNVENTLKIVNVFLCMCAFHCTCQSKKLTISQRHCVESWRTEFYQNRARNAEITHVVEVCLPLHRFYLKSKLTNSIAWRSNIPGFFFIPVRNVEIMGKIPHAPLSKFQLPLHRL
jgi:hypothetical protein